MAEHQSPCVWAWAVAYVEWWLCLWRILHMICSFWHYVKRWTITFTFTPNLISNHNTLTLTIVTLIITLAGFFGSGSGQNFRWCQIEGIFLHKSKALHPLSISILHVKSMSPVHDSDQMRLPPTFDLLHFQTQFKDCLVVIKFYDVSKVSLKFKTHAVTTTDLTYQKYSCSALHIPHVFVVNVTLPLDSGQTTNETSAKTRSI